MARVEYVFPLGERARKRHFHETSRGTVVALVVQLEVLLDGRWAPVVRYDSVHGFSHIDRFSRSGESCKERLFFSFAEALTAADEDIPENWELYRTRFLDGDWP